MDARSQEDPRPKTTPKSPVVRGARACTVCRAAKMKCVGAEDGQKQCQRCKRANVECIFEKHRRGRKPGSKLSEASKMLRRLEKGLTNAKLKSQSAQNAVACAQPVSRAPSQDQRFSGAPGTTEQYGSSSNHFSSNELPPLNLPPYGSSDGYAASSHESRSIGVDDDFEDADRNDEGMYPTRMIRRENRRQSFFRTVLGPEHDHSASPPRSAQDNLQSTPPPQDAQASTVISDPITAGIIEEDQVKVIFDLIFLRLNPFVNMFDPALHSVNYVRSKCPFLFTVLIMAGCKFFKPELYKQCRKLANEHAIRAFAEGWKRVEVVQAFTCLVHWKEPDENRTWTFIGYACRMAVEMGLNTYFAEPPAHETEFQMRERRNRERTYLVLFVHDRSLSMQTGRQWMLPLDDLVRQSTNWHEQGGSTIRPEDVIVAAFVQLRRIASDTTDAFKAVTFNHHEVNYEVLRDCNAQLTQWMDNWQHEMRRAGGETFHFSMLSFFRLHVRLFLNSFALQASMTPSSRVSPNPQALSACYTSSLETLQIVSRDFASMSMLRYGQDSITVMTAYSAVFLLKLLRSPSILTQLHEGNAHEIHSMISKTADAYQDASTLSPASSAAAYHARFLRNLVANDIFIAQQDEKDALELTPIESRLQGQQPQSVSGSHQAQPLAQNFPRSVVQDQFPASSPPPTGSSHDPPELRRASRVMPLNDQPQTPQFGFPVASTQTASSQASGFMPQHESELDAHYWRNMFQDLGYPTDALLILSQSGRGINSGEGLRALPYVTNTQNYHSPSHPQASSHQPHTPHTTPSRSTPQVPYHIHGSVQAPYGR